MLNKVEKKTIEYIQDNRIASMESENAAEFKDRLKEDLFRRHIKLNKTKAMSEKKSFFRQYGKYLVPSTVALAVVIALTSVFFLSGKKEDDKNDKEKSLLGSEIAYVEGQVEYKDGDDGWREAESGKDLKEGSSVRVLGEGKAIVNLDDGSSVRLNNDSELKLSSMDPDHIVISNEKGEVFSRVVKAERKFEIKTDEVTYRSLGTAYKTVNLEDKKGVEVYHSRVSLEEKDVIVEEGEKFYLSEEEKKEITLDEIKSDEFALWNKEQDEKVEEYKGYLGMLSDLEGPRLKITSITDGQKTESEKVKVEGEVEKGAEVKVNGEEVQNNEGKFSKEVSLKVGENKITVIAIDMVGNKTEKTVKVIREEPEPVVTAGIKLSASKTDSGIYFKWSVTGVDVSKGFKLVKSTKANPVYPGNDYEYLSSSKTRSFTWKITDGKTYHFRICQYLGDGKCGKYSNDITVTAPKVASVEVRSISASISGKKLVWTVDGTSEKGFKVVWSKNTSPVYPTRTGDKYQYFSSSSHTSSNELTAFDGEGTYYVRVCEYLGGACGVYSNQVTVTL